ncbi:MAG: primosomal protein N' [Fimbriimonadales bacterium]|nr:primosomal protein N' [Fimbriimonadales bacterium]
MHLAEVIVFAGGSAGYTPFTYRVPDSLRAGLQAGAGVLVPFGGRMALGVVWRLYEGEPPLPWEQLRPIESVLNQPLLDNGLMELAQQLQQNLLCSPAEAVQTVLPALARASLHTVVELVEPVPPLRSVNQRMVVDALRAAGGRISLQSLKQRLAAPILNSGLSALRQKGVIRTTYELEPPPNPAQGEAWVELIATPEQLEPFFQQEANRARVQTALLVRLLLHPEGRMSVRELLEQTGASASSLRQLETRGLVRRLRPSERAHPDALGEPQEGGSPVPSPTPAQQAAIRALNQAIEAGRYHAFLLYGVTGSGKTEVYLQAAAAALRAGRTVLFLVPEIALTAQLTAAFRERFGSSVAVLHSQLNPSERYAHWLRVRAGQTPIVVGARSAIFAPMRALGLIVLDEEHEPAYKQGQTPYYHARRLAEVRAREEQAVLLLGSATPALETFYRAQQGELQLLRLPERIGGTPLPEVELIDMRAQPRLALSPPLLEAIRETTARGQQVILFLNRRGFAPMLLCRECGHVPMCEQCAVSLTYHVAGERVLRCHHCNARVAAPSLCPNCRGTRIAPYGIGTQRVEMTLKGLLPNLRVARLDRDVLNRRDLYLQLLQAFRAGELDVLIGTQMVARGLDFPRVMLVGVLNADTALHLPDVRAAERTFQLLMQVAGRAGRREQQGRTLIQTFNPDHHAIQFAARHDYEGFYQHELEARREPLYPPFCRLANLLTRHENPERAWRALQQLAAALESARGNGLIQLLGPAPAPLERVEGRYRYHLLLKFAPESEPADWLRDTVARLEPPDRAAIQVDIDPVSLM